MNSIEPKRARRHAYQPNASTWTVLGHVHEAVGLPVHIGLDCPCMSGDTTCVTDVSSARSHMRTPPWEATREQAKEWARRLAAWLFNRRVGRDSFPDDAIANAGSARMVREHVRQWIAFLDRCGGYEAAS